MNIKIICVGKLKEKYWVDAVREYSRRLTPYCSLDIEELKEYRLMQNAGPSEEEEVRVNEGREILEKIQPSDYVISLEIRGKRLSSEELAEKISDLGLSSRSDIDFIIGGSLGLSGDVSRRADYRLSFSDMTFPHQMMRVILLEQIYRAFKIQRGEPYHK